jgi:hypothetical protein
MMAVMTVAKAPPEMWPDVWPHEDRPLTVRDMENMPDDGNRYELDEGMLIVSPAPFNNHQIVTDNIRDILRAARTPDFIVVSGPGINLSELQHRIPHVAVIRREGFKVGRVFEKRPLCSLSRWHRSEPNSTTGHVRRRSTSSTGLRRTGSSTQIRNGRRSPRFR